MSVIDMFIALCRKNDALYTIVEEKRCPSCSEHSCKSMVSLPLNCAGLDLRNITRSLRFKNLNKTCSGCDVGEQLEIHRKFNPVLAIDLDGMLNPNISIDQIQQQLGFENMEYSLYGIVAIQPNHFVAHVRRSDGWQTFDDLHPTEVKKVSSSTIIHPVLLMYSQLHCDTNGKWKNKFVSQGILIIFSKFI